MSNVDSAAARRPIYAAFRPQPPRGLRALLPRRLPAEILVDDAGVAVALYDDESARAYSTFGALLRAHALRGDELEYRGLGR